MSDLSIKAVITKDGAKFFDVSAAAYGLNPQSTAFLTGKLKSLAEHAKTKGSAGGSALVATLSATLDGTAAPDVVVSGMSKDVLHTVEDEMLALGHELLKASKDKAAKAKK
jgi:hypothetical protein